MTTDCIVFGVLMPDASEDWPGRNRLLEDLALRHAVVFLERGSSRRSILSPVTIGRSGSHPEVRVAHHAIALSDNRWTRRLGPLASSIDRWRLRRALAREGLTRPLLWLTVPEPRLYRAIPHAEALFDCMDPCFEPARQEQFDRDEAWVVRRSRLVFASAWSLQRRMARIHDDVVLLPNAADAVDVARFVQPPSVGHRPRVGYLGTLDRRIDGELLVALAEALPEVDLVLGGRVNDPDAEYVQRLKAMPHVTLTGQIGTEEGRDLVAGLDVGIIPFTPGEMNDAVNPVKLFMYLAYGKPVVATDLEECRRNEYVETARDTEEFVALVRSALEADPDAAARHAFAAANTWSVRAGQAEDALRTRGLIP